MNCPHCGVECLLGTKVCLSCGRSVSSRPRFQAHSGSIATQFSPAAKPVQPPPTIAPTAATPTVFGPTTPTVFMPTSPTMLAQDQTSAAVAAAFASVGAPTNAPSPAPAATPVAPISNAQGLVLCRVCLQSFSRRIADTGAPVCPACRDFSEDGGDAGQNEVKIHPNAAETAGVDPRAAGEVKQWFRPAPKRPRRVGAVVAAAGLVLCLAAVALVVTRGGKSDTSKYLVGVKAEDAKFAVAADHDAIVRLETTTSLRIARQGAREEVARKLEDLLRLDQKTVQTADVGWVRDDAAGAVLDCETDCRVASQTGVGPRGTDGREHKAYPWEGFHATMRLVVPPSGAVTGLAGEDAVCGRDVPPVFTLRDIGAPTGAVTAGTTWKATLNLPLLANRDGALFRASFPCELKYEGKRTINGTPTYAVSVAGTAPTNVPPELEDMNRIAGSLSAVLCYDAATGMLVEGHAAVDVTVTLERGRVDDRVHVVGTMDSKRR